MIAARFRWLRTTLRRLFRRGKQESELDSEMQFHFDQLVAEFETEGMSKARATAAAHREFGTTDSYREEIRDSWRPPAFRDAYLAISLAIRSLRRSPGFSVLAIVTLGLGIGANTAMFSLGNAIVLKPLPFPNQDELYHLYRATPQDATGSFSMIEWKEVNAAKEHFGEIAGSSNISVSLAPAGEPPEMAETKGVTANFLSTLGVQPMIGRGFRSEENASGLNRVVILSHRFWQNRFGGRSDILNTEVRINGTDHEIIGVLDESFGDWRLYGWVDLLRPLDLNDPVLLERSEQSMMLVGRRAEHISAVEAEGFLATFGENRATQYPTENAGAAWKLQALTKTAAGDNGQMVLLMLVGLSGFVVLICCSNLANFLLARTMARAREFAVRSALGASRGQLLRPLLLESLLLSLAGGILALIIADVFTDWLQYRSTSDNGDQVIVALDQSVFIWTLGCSIFTALIFSLAPSLFALRLNMNAVLKSGGRGATGSRAQQRLRQALIVGQFAMAVVLLTGATLFIRGLHDLNSNREGWESEGLVTGTFLLPDATYPDAQSRRQFQSLALEQLQNLLGVTSASLARYHPFLRWGNQGKFEIIGRPPVETGREPATRINTVSPDYFTTVSTPLTSGRLFDSRDHENAPRRIVINETMARTLFPNASPLGQRLRWLTATDDDAGSEIIGVVKDVKSIFPEANPITFQIYQPLSQIPVASTQIALRSETIAPGALVKEIRNLMNELDPDLPVIQLKSADARIVRENYELGVLRDMLGLFGALGLVLASLGIYGVIARLVAQRHTEFGIRIALGAPPNEINRLVLASGFWMIVWGSLFGILGSIGLAKLLQMGFPSMPHDPLSSLLVSLLVLIVVAILASLWPARRASAIDPCDALRAE